MSSNENNPSLIGGHAQYVKGAAEPPGIQEVIGNVTGSAPWTESGTNDKQAGVASMKAASAQRDGERQGFGAVEEAAGKAVGCEGMVKEGAESKTTQQ